MTCSLFSCLTVLLLALQLCLAINLDGGEEDLGLREEKRGKFLTRNYLLNLRNRFSPFFPTRYTKDRYKVELGINSTDTTNIHRRTMTGWIPMDSMETHFPVDSETFTQQENKQRRHKIFEIVTLTE